VGRLEWTLPWRWRGRTLVTWCRGSPRAGWLFVIEPGATHDYVSALLEQLAPQALAYDPVGNGRSQHAPGLEDLGSLELAATELAALLGRLAIPTVLLAHLGGIAVALEALQRSEAPVAGLVALAPRLEPPPTELDPFGPLAPATPHHQASAAWVRAYPAVLGAWRSRGLAEARARRNRWRPPSPIRVLADADDRAAAKLAEQLGVSLEPVSLQVVRLEDPSGVAALLR
jgi:alpha-beta hydrolase superfamily lysophospholipase